MRNIKLKVTYDGSCFHGFQVQPGLTTIQGLLEEGIQALTGETVKVIGSGRTDAGVHALGQVVNFRTTSSIPIARWKPALNSRLPKEVRVIEAQEVPEEFHARYSAVAKSYRYLIVTEAPVNPVLDRYSWRIDKPLDRKAMQEAARLLIGRHDFAAFQTSGSSAQTTIRRVIRSELSLIQGVFPPAWGETTVLAYDITADGFLYNMVRNIVGWLVKVGEGTLDVAEAAKIFAAGDRSLVGKPAPACGLWLMEVQY
ncbi:MAG: tRNA pseudouridine(38-40) synthase TruA [Firmicutes bacterium]|nr:tRNA pseudouridine(38-40) synthase TruA [Bacillota bacterium]